MTLDEWLSRNSIGTAEFAARLNITGEAVRLYRVGKRHPRAHIMHAIMAATAGAVEPNDFYPPAPERPASGEAAA